jgi:hypothetical protein
MKYLSPLDLQGLELLNVRFQNLGAAPSTMLGAGRIYYDSGLNMPRWYDGTTFQNIYKATTSTNGTAVLRDQSGNFTAGTITANLTGNASTASALTPGATIAISGKATATGTLFTGGSNISLNVSALSVVPGDVILASGFMIVGNGSGAGAAVAKSAIPLNDFAPPNGSLSAGGQLITNVAYPSANTDAANKQYVDETAQGLSVKAAVKAATTSNITLNGDQTIDGVSIGAGDRVLVKAQTAGQYNGIYVAQSGSWTRATDADENSEVASGMFVFVTSGTTNANSGWILTTANPITVGTTPLSFAQFSGAGQIDAGSGLTKSGNTLHVGGTSDRITVNADSVDISANYAGQTTITTLGTVTTGTWSAATIAVNKGGTGMTSYAVGDIVYASGATTLSGLADVATGNALISGGVGVAPSWGKIGLTTHVTGTLAAGNGGTGNTSYSNGDLLVGNGSALTKLGSGAQYTVLMSAGSGAGVSWSTISLLNTVGTLPTNRGGTGVTSFTSGGLLVGAGTGNVGVTSSPTVGGQIAVSSGSGAWSVASVSGDAAMSSAGALTLNAGVVTYAKMQTVAAVSVIGNATGSTATPTAISAGADNQYLRRRSGGLGFGAPVYAANIPTATPGVALAINHNLGTDNIIASIYEVAGSKEQVFTDIDHVDSNTINVVFANGAGSGEYRIVVVGL